MTEGLTPRYLWSWISIFSPSNKSTHHFSISLFLIWTDYSARNIFLHYCGKIKNNITIWINYLLTNFITEIFLWSMYCKVYYFQLAWQLAVKISVDKHILRRIDGFYAWGGWFFSFPKSCHFFIYLKKE